MSKSIKDYNLRSVADLIRARKVATSRDISIETGLSIVTVNAIVSELAERDVVRPGELVPSMGGRPARQYALNGECALSLMVFPHEEDEKDVLSVRVVDLYGRAAYTRDVAFVDVSISSIKREIDRALSRFSSVRSIAFGLPGVEHDGTLIALDYEPLRGVPLVPRIEEAYGLPVTCENDVNAAAYGRGLAPNAPASEVYLYVPERYPPGAGIRINGSIIKGRRNLAGEVANLPLGIPWGKTSLSRSLDQSCEAVSKVVASISSVIAPESVVLASPYLGERHVAGIRARLSAMLPGDMVPSLTLAERFLSDYERGLAGLAADGAYRGLWLGTR